MQNAQDKNAAMFSDGAAYERLMGRWSQKVGHRFLDWLAAAPGQDWLDVGCGNGAFTEVIQTRSACATLTGIDPSMGLIDFAKHRAGADRAVFQTADAQQLPFADATFDVSVMALAIAFIPDPALAVTEMARVTRPGGTCATYMWDLPGEELPLAPMFRALAAMGHIVPMPPSAPISTRAALQQLWVEAGLDDVKLQSIQITVTFDDFDDFWQSNTQPAGPQAALLRSLCDTDRDKLRTALRASLPTDAHGHIAFSSVANAVKGRRPAISKL